MATTPFYVMSRAGWTRQRERAWPPGSDQKLLEREARTEYPKPTFQVTAELTARGIAITYPAFNNLLVRGRVPKPPGDATEEEGRERLRWLQEDVDEAVAMLAELGYLTAEARGCAADWVSFDQVHDAEHQARAAGIDLDRATRVDIRETRPDGALYRRVYLPEATAADVEAWARQLSKRG